MTEERNGMETKESKNKKRRWVVGVFVVISVMLYLQHRYMYMYFDDYGYASLTYGNDQYYNNGVLTIPNLFRYLLWHYMNWGGRIVCFFFEICLLNLGVNAARIVQAVLIAGSIVCSALLLKPKAKKQYLVAVFLLLACYFSWSLEIYRDGIFWFSASISYVWPICPFFVAILLQRRYFEKGQLRNAILGALFFFLAAFSQEQVAVMVIVYNLLVCIYCFLVQKKRAASNFVFLIFAVLGGGIEILAPGNFTRAVDPRYAEFQALSLPEKILQNIPEVININIGTNNLKLSVLVVLVSAWVFWQHGARRTAKAAKILAAVEILLAVGVIVGFYRLPSKSTLSVVLILAWIVVFCVEAILDFLVDQNIYLLGLWVGGIFSQGMMLVSPSISLRSSVPFLFVLDLITAYFAIKYLGKDMILYAVTAMIFCISLMNAVAIYHGYHRNAETQEINDAIMRVNCVAIQQGAQVDEITLYRLQDDLYANSMAYQPGTDFIEYWLKYYYRIPQEVKVVWTDPLQ